MPPASIPGGWTDTLDKKILLGIVAQSNISNIKWDDIAASLGENVPGSAVATRFNRIRSSMKAATSDGPKTPAKRGGGKKAGGSSTGKRKASAPAKDSEDGGEDEDDAEETPVKKPKTGGKAVVVKEEKTEEADSDYDGLL